MGLVAKDLGQQALFAEVQRVPSGIGECQFICKHGNLFLCLSIPAG